MDLSIEEALAIRSELTYKLSGNIYTFDDEVLKVLGLWVWPKDIILRERLKKLSDHISSNEEVLSLHTNWHKNDRFELYVRIVFLDAAESTAIFDEITIKRFAQGLGLELNEFLHLFYRTMEHPKKKAS